MNKFSFHPAHFPPRSSDGCIPPPLPQNVLKHPAQSDARIASPRPSRVSHSQRHALISEHQGASGKHRQRARVRNGEVNATLPSKVAERGGGGGTAGLASPVQTAGSRWPWRRRMRASLSLTAPRLKFPERSRCVTWSCRGRCWRQSGGKDWLESFKSRYSFRRRYRASRCSTNGHRTLLQCVSCGQ